MLVSYFNWTRYNDDILREMASQITSLTIVYSTIHSVANQRKHQSSAPLAFVRGIYWCSVNSRHKGPVTRKMFSFDDVIMFFLKHLQSPQLHIYKKGNIKDAGSDSLIHNSTAWCYPTPFEYKPCFHVRGFAFVKTVLKSKSVVIRRSWDRLCDVYSYICLAT